MALNNETIVGQDLVAWVMLGIVHVPRSEVSNFSGISIQQALSNDDHDARHHQMMFMMLGTVRAPRRDLWLSPALSSFSSTSNIN